MHRAVNLFQAAVILSNLAIARKDKDVGFEDADRTYDEVIDAFTRGGTVSVKQEVLESALWACNLLDERGKFFHPSGKSFDRFLKLLLSRQERFNRDLNFIEAIKK